MRLSSGLVVMPQWMRDGRRETKGVLTMTCLTSWWEVSTLWAIAMVYHQELSKLGRMRSTGKITSRNEWWDFYVKAVGLCTHSIFPSSMNSSSCSNYCPLRASKDLDILENGSLSRSCSRFWTFFGLLQTSELLLRLASWSFLLPGLLIWQRHFHLGMYSPKHRSPF